jgi:geranylgeranyl diphosphate synthase type II
MDLKTYLKGQIDYIEKLLLIVLPEATEKPCSLHEAMRYTMMGGGKRLRPVLCIAAAEACGGSRESASFAACAVECLHTYSLVHDDLPAMDNDDFRRGRATCHKVYGEAMGILVGDALQAFAFELIVKTPVTLRYGAGRLVEELARCAGSRHLVGGQVADLEGEKQRLGLEDLIFVHKNKTSALLTSSLRLGAMSADAGEEELAALTQFGQSLGLAFQVIDDILDVTQSSEVLGKSAGKDEQSMKSTFPALMGLEASKNEAKRLTQQALDALKPLGVKALRLQEIALYMLERNN